MREERELSGHTWEGERRDNEMFYNLIMHMEFTVFSYALGNTVDVL
jgi:hypothetical protein